MKNSKIYLVCLSLSLIAFSCEKDELDPSVPGDTIIQTEIPFSGVWHRQFEAGPGNDHDVYYRIYQDSIRYTLTGPVGNADYVLLRDTFLLENNRFIGHTPNDEYYLIFVKEHNSDSLTLYKEAVQSVTDGMYVAVPNDTTTQNHGWNTYFKQ